MKSIMAKASYMNQIFLPRIKRNTRAFTGEGGKGKELDQHCLVLDWVKHFFKKEKKLMQDIVENKKTNLLEKYLGK